MSKPVCSKCNDTHVMNDEHHWACTFCPVPCQSCRAHGTGAFCENTPCGCACHVKRKLVPTVSLPADQYGLLTAKARVCDAFVRIHSEETDSTAQKELNAALADLVTAEARVK